MKEDKRAAKVLQILRETFAMPKWTKSKRNPFETLIVTVISQNTADRNTPLGSPAGFALKQLETLGFPFLSLNPELACSVS